MINVIVYSKFELYLYSILINKTCVMKTIIFKSEKKAKVYEVRSSKNQGCYKENELIRIVKTDNINELINNGQYQEIAIEVK